MTDPLERDVLKWYNKQQYNRIGNDISVTELMRPPRVNHLTARYKQVRPPKTKVSKIIASLQGNGVHDQLQRYLKREASVNNNWMVERRLCSVIDGVRVSGRFDAMYNREDLYDIKVTKAYKFIKGDFYEWEEQLNAYDWMLWKDGISIKHLRIYMVVSDWNRGETHQRNYPPTNINIISIKKWDRTEQENWMRTRVGLWKSSKSLKDEDLPLCTNKERWATNTIWKLYRTPTLKRATKTFPTEARAKAYMNVCQRKDPSKWGTAVIEPYVGDQWKRCDWCDAQPNCNQYQNKILP